MKKNLEPTGRYRSRNSIRAGATNYSVASGPVANSTTSAGSSGAQGWREDMNDVVVPSFSARVKRGEVFFNPMTKYRQEFVSSSQLASLTQFYPPNAVGQKYSYAGDMLGQRLAEFLPGHPNTLVSPVDLGALPVSACISEACTSASVRPTDGAMLVALAESRATLAQLPDLYRTLGDYLRRFNSAAPPRSVAGFGRTLRDSVSVHERVVTDLWLQMRFGLRPLISDIQGALTAIHRQYTDAIVRQTGRGYGSKSLDEVTHAELSNGIIQSPYTRVTRNAVSVRATSLWESKMTFLDELGLSPRAIPEAVLDLTRFSFVANWMINANSFAASIGRGLDLDAHLLGSCYTVLIEKSTVWQLTGGDYNTQPTVYNTVGSSSGLATASSILKYRVAGLVSPSLVVRGDPFKFLTDLRLLDATALVAQQFRGRNFSTALRLAARGVI